MRHPSFSALFIFHLTNHWHRCIIGREINRSMIDTFIPDSGNGEQNKRSPGRIEHPSAYLHLSASVSIRIVMKKTRCDSGQTNRGSTLSPSAMKPFILGRRPLFMVRWPGYRAVFSINLQGRVTAHKWGGTLIIGSAPHDRRCLDEGSASAAGSQSFEAAVYRRFIDALWGGRFDGGWPDGVQVRHLGQCCECGRILTNATSIALGIGPICRGHIDRRRGGLFS